VRSHLYQVVCAVEFKQLDAPGDAVTGLPLEASLGEDDGPLGEGGVRGDGGLLGGEERAVGERPGDEHQRHGAERVAGPVFHGRWRPSPGMGRF
jgi:hypothetical protein